MVSNPKSLIFRKNWVVLKTNIHLKAAWMIRFHQIFDISEKWGCFEEHIHFQSCLAFFGSSRRKTKTSLDLNPRIFRQKTFQWLSKAPFPPGKLEKMATQHMADVGG